MLLCLQFLQFLVLFGRFLVFFSFRGCPKLPGARTCLHFFAIFSKTLICIVFCHFWVFFKTSRAPKSRPPDPLRAGCGATFGECVFFRNLPGMASFWGSLGGWSPPPPPLHLGASETQYGCYGAIFWCFFDGWTWYFSLFAFFCFFFVFLEMPLSGCHQDVAFRRKGFGKNRPGGIFHIHFW